ncbi:hypothetical protein TanjilG_15871 [Lupinus angustifolius]|uniref:Uncharacterized protein n=1 Tax=Lupinus angustifolius TaxID=3871 RepID=A0A1J7FNV3_LUPAN|nr:hypothetical protein TanjilG_15871 [Lupinus angustifolius]
MPPGINKGNAKDLEECAIEQAPLSVGNEDVEVNLTGIYRRDWLNIQRYEVESQMCAGNASSLICDGWSEPPRIRYVSI